MIEDISAPVTTSDGQLQFTKATRWLATTTSLRPYVLFRGTVCVRGMFVSDLAEKLDLVFAREERCRDRVNRRITPALFV